MPWICCESFSESAFLLSVNAMSRGACFGSDIAETCFKYLETFGKGQEMLRNLLTMTGLSYHITPTYCVTGGNEPTVKTSVPTMPVAVKPAW
jgi:hypothetical protein